MLMLLCLLLASYILGILLPLSILRRPQMQGILESVCAGVAGRGDLRLRGKERQ